MATNVAGVTPSMWDQTEAGSAPAKSQGNADINKEMFLRLLVTQIRNQNPLSPMDGVQFLTQLAEFSNLEQMVAIREDVAAIRGNLEPAAPEIEGSQSLDEEIA